MYYFPFVLSEYFPLFPPPPFSHCSGQISDNEVEGKSHCLRVVLKTADRFQQHAQQLCVHFREAHTCTTNTGKLFAF